MLLLQHDQRGQEVADSEHIEAKSIYTVALKLQIAKCQMAFFV